jgi:chorismate dehydratase
VSYLNTKPLLYGIEHSPIIDEISLTTQYPALIADMLLKDEIDIGLVPVSIIPQMKEYYINTNYCIGANGPVASVCLLSEHPLNEIKTVLLDYQSRTSLALARLLFEKYWKLHPHFIPAGPDFLNQIGGDTAAVVIGDRALEIRRKYSFTFDLGQAWKEMTGLPFVFAAWISNKKLDTGWVSRFDKANAFGIHHLSTVIKELPISSFDLSEYFHQYLSYNLDEEKKKGLSLFLKMLGDKISS